MHHAEGRELSTVAQFVLDVPHLLYCGLYQYPQFTSLFPFRVNLGVFACDLINDRFQLVLSMSRRSISASRRRLSLVLLSDSLEVISELSVRAGRLSARVGYVIQANLFCLCCGSLHPGGQGVRACHTSTYLSPSKKKHGATARVDCARLFGFGVIRARRSPSTHLLQILRQASMHQNTTHGNLLPLWSITHNVSCLVQTWLWVIDRVHSKITHW